MAGPRLVVAGTGAIGRRHLDHIVDHPAMELAAIIDPDPRMHALADAPGFADLKAVNVEADGIVIATPTDTHADLAIASLERGWHVLVEKPVAHSPQATVAIAEAARKANRKVLVGHHRRHHPKVAALKALIASGEIGAPIAASTIWCMKKPADYFDVAWRQSAEGAPVRMNLIHEVDLLRHLFGEIEEVAGFGANPVRRANRPESGGAVLRFSSGAIVTVTFADTAPSPWGFEAATGENPNIAFTGIDNLRIACTGGAVSFPSLRVWSGAEDWGHAPDMRTLTSGDGVPLVRQLEHFAEVIAGRAEPLITAEDGAATLIATLAIEKATWPKEAADA